MRNLKAYLGVILVALASAGAGLALFFWLEADRVGVGAAAAPVVLGEPRAAFALPDLTGVERSIGHWDGRVLLINFWATWCPPCRKEIPDLITLQTEYGARGLQVIGVAFDETAAVVDYATEMGMNYPVLVQEGMGVDLAAAYGNPAALLPYTVVVDRAGIIRATHKGLLLRDQAVAMFEALL
jgi:thiol-disulfide isomerase/thioredoxin